MALIECPECGSKISDKASACPKCGCPSSEFEKADVALPEKVATAAADETESADEAAEKEAMGESDPDTSGRIIKNDPNGNMSFIASDDESVYLKCGECGKVYSFKREYFDNITEDGCTAPIEMECPACKRKRTRPEVVNKRQDEPTACREKPRDKPDKQSVGCLAGAAGALGVILTFVFVGMSSNPKPLPALIVLLVSFAGIRYWFHTIPEPTAEESKRLEEMVERQKYNGLKYTCPMCGGHKVKTIGTGRKMASAMTLGVAGRSLGKNYQCDDCKYRW